MGKLNSKRKISMSKINQEQLKQKLAWVRENRKERKFAETLDLQILLRDYNPEKEKRFNSSVVLPNKAKTNIKVCVIGNVNHMDECKAKGIPCIDLDGVKKFNKQPKPIKKWARTFDFILVSDTLNKQVAAQIGKILSSVHKLPLQVPASEKIVDKIQELHYSCRWRMKKVPWLAQGVGVDNLKDEEIRQNVNKSLNFLMSLLPKGWHNIRTVHVKYGMGRPQRIF